jgi:hypothetical protein
MELPSGPNKKGGDTMKTIKNGQDKQSYLTRTQAEFETLVGTLMATESATDSPEQAISHAAEQLWHFVSDKIRESFWNGVSAGKSGRVKPKDTRPQPGKTYRLTGATKQKAISNGNTWTESEVTDEQT